MRLVTGDAALDCARLPLPACINAQIIDATVGRALLQLQEEHKVEWQEYTFQTVLDAIGVEAIVAAVYDQYVEELSEDYIGYKKPNDRNNDHAPPDLVRHHKQIKT